MQFTTQKNYILTIMQLHPKRNRKEEYSAYIMPTALNKQRVSFDIKDDLFGNGFLNADYSSYAEFKKSSLFRVFHQFSEEEFNSAKTMLNNLGENLSLDYLEWFFDFQNISFTSDVRYAQLNQKTDEVIYDNSFGIIEQIATGKISEEEYPSLNDIYNKVHSDKFSLKCYSYHCHNLEELICAELYFYLSNGYTFKHCKHCGKLFPVKNRNIDYCGRNSNIEKYSHLPCVEAQQRLRKNSGAKHPLRKRYNVLTSTLDRLINQVSSPVTEKDKKEFLETAKKIRQTKTDEEYSQWIYEQELKYKTRTKKAVSK